MGKPRPDELFPLEVGHPVGEEGEGEPAAPGLRQEGLRLRVQGVAAPLPEEGLGELPRPFGGPPRLLEEEGVPPLPEGAAALGEAELARGPVVHAASAQG
mgnify:CR=1 FL=1